MKRHYPGEVTIEGYEALALRIAATHQRGSREALAAMSAGDEMRAATISSMAAVALARRSLRLIEMHKRIPRLGPDAVMRAAAARAAVIDMMRAQSHKWSRLREGAHTSS